MQVLRLLFLFGAFFGFGLVLQPSAYASAHPVVAATAAQHCGMMSHGETGDSAPQGRNDCEHMLFGCVFSTACTSPLYNPDETSLVRPLEQAVSLYAPVSSAEPPMSSRGPEPPPPQSRF